MSPFGNTGWTWPVVNINIEDEEIKANIITRMTPIFIDGLHVKQDVLHLQVFIEDLDWLMKNLNHSMTVKIPENL